MSSTEHTNYFSVPPCSAFIEILTGSLLITLAFLWTDTSVHFSSTGFKRAVRPCTVSTLHDQRAVCAPRLRPAVFAASSPRSSSAVADGTPTGGAPPSALLPPSHASERVRRLRFARAQLVAPHPPPAPTVLQELLDGWPVQRPTPGELPQAHLELHRLVHHIRGAGWDGPHLGVACRVLAHLARRDRRFKPSLRWGCGEMVKAACEGSAAGALSGGTAVKLAYSYAQLGATYDGMAPLMRRLREEQWVSTLSFQKWTMLLATLARVQPPQADEPLLAAMGDRLQVLGLRNLSAQDLGLLLWALAKLRWSYPLAHTDLLDRLRQPAVLQAMTAKTTTLVVWALATLGVWDEAVVRGLRDRAMDPRVLASFNAQDLALTFHAYANLRIRDLEFFDCLANQSFRTVRQFRALNIANTMWAMATLGVVHDQLIHALVQSFVQPSILVRAQPQNVANTLWAMARLRYYNHRALQVIAAYIVRERLMFSGRQLSIIAWAYASLGVRHRPLLRHLAVQAASRETLKTLSSQSISNFVWACSTLNLVMPDFFYLLSLRALQPQVLKSFTAQGIANTLWAYSKLPSLQQEIFDRLIALALRSEFKDFTLPTLAMTCWALADVYWHPEASVVHVLLRRTMEQLEAFPRAPCSGATLVVLLAAFTRLRLYHEPMVARLTECILQHQLHEQFMAQEISLLSMALSDLPRPSVPLVRAVYLRAVHPDVLRDYSPRTLRRTTEALALLGVRPAQLAPLRERDPRRDAPFALFPNG